MSWLTAEQALALLGTKPQSLYASVSRGRIRARPDPDDPRKGLYHRDDVERLAARGGGGPRKAASVAADAIRWGDPVLPSAVSTVHDGRLYYRGRDTVRLADSASLEDVAALLWETPVAAFVAGEPLEQPVGGEGLGMMLMTLASDPALDLGDGPETAAPGLIGRLAQALQLRGDAPLHRRLASRWRRPEAAGLLRRALVLLADHELNPSTFAVRIAISTGASPAAALLAGLAVLSGPRHGGAPAEVQRLAVLLRRNGAAALLREMRDGVLPGFGHRLYPAGDPRAVALLDQLALPQVFADLAAAGRDLTGEAPNVDFALAALAAAYALPADAPLQLFALARSIGWLAHAIEQHRTGTVIRPRAAYVGPRLEEWAEEEISE